MNLERILPYLLYKFKSDDELVSSIEELSRKFTQEREKITDYLKDPRLVSAYAAFYFTTNTPKFAEILKWLPEEFLTAIKTSDLVDIGAGPGTFSVAFQEWSESLSGRIVQIETSELMREQAKIMWEGLYPSKNMVQSFGRNLKGENQIALFGHSANEMGAEKALSYIEDIDPEHIIFIEPGTKSFFPEMLKIRKALLARGYHIIFPCPNSMECPMAASEKDWCHQFIYLKQSQDIERLSQMAKKDRRLLPLIVHVYSKNSFGVNPSERVVRVLPETKFSYEWEVCHDNRLEHDQVMKRNLSKAEQSTLEGILAGAAVETETEKVLENSKRVKLIKINNQFFKP